MSKKNTVRRIKMAKSAQQTLPFKEIYENGLIGVEYVTADKKEQRYTLVCSMSNTDYQLLQEKNQKTKADAYAAVFNSLPQDIHWQELYMTIDVDADGLRDALIPPGLPRQTEFQRDYIRNQTAFIKEAEDSISDCRLYFAMSYAPKNRLDNPYNILLSYFSTVKDRLMALDVAVELLPVEKTLELFHDIYNPYEHGNFRMPGDMYAQGTNIRDYIAPPHFGIKFRQIEMGASVSRVYFVRSFSQVLTDSFIRDLLDTKYRVVVSKHVDHILPAEAEARLEKRLRKLESERQTRNQNNHQNGTNYIPYYLQVEIDACKETLDILRKKEQLFEVGIYVMVSANSVEELNDVGALIKSAAMRNRVMLQEIAARLEDALFTMSPIACDYLRMDRSLPSTALSVLHPFSYRRQFAQGGYFYGFNTDARTPIIHNRKASRNGNCFVVGQSGSGKSMFSKLEITDTLMLAPQDQILAIDPEAEFVSLANQVEGGRVFDLRAGSNTFINPFDLPVDMPDENPINDKTDLILSMMAAFKRQPLTAQEISITSRCVLKVYEKYMVSKDPEDIPTFKDFYDALDAQPEEEKRDLRLYLEMYIFGSCNLFAEKTNLDLSGARFGVFQLNRLGSFLKEPGMLFVLDLTWQLLLQNFHKGNNTWLYADECQEYYKTAQGGEYFERVFGRFRKYGGLATGLTQNLNDILARDTAKGILQNSDMVVLFQQAQQNELAAAELYDLSDGHRKYLKRPKPGEGLLIVDRLPTPFSHLYPEDNAVYKAITTKFTDKWGT